MKFPARFSEVQRQREGMISTKTVDNFLWALTAVVVLFVALITREVFDLFVILSFSFSLFGSLSYTKALVYGENFYVHIYNVRPEQKTLRVFAVILMWALLGFVIFWMIVPDISSLK